MLLMPKLFSEGFDIVSAVRNEQSELCQVGDYNILCRLAGGKVTSIYLCEDVKSTRKVILKNIHEQNLLTALDQMTITDYEAGDCGQEVVVKEAAILKALTHPNIVGFIFSLREVQLPRNIFIGDGLHF